MKFVAAFVLAVALIVGFSTAAFADDNPGHLSNREKSAKEWTPKIEAKFRKGLEVQSPPFDVDCFVREIKREWHSPRAFYREAKKHKTRLQYEVTGMSMDCMK